MPPNNIVEQKLWDTEHVYLIGPYSKSIRQHRPGVTTIKNNVSLTWLAMIDPATYLFEIVKVSMYDPNEIVSGNNEYIDKS